jgi:GNAT superfamily N-acetyltransferase
VGFVAVGPGADDDAGTDGAEVFELLVENGAQRAGHGSRLLTAAVDHLREHGYRRAVTWLFEADEPAMRFYTSAGWAVDGSRRTLEMGEPVEQIRLHTGLEEVS